MHEISIRLCVDIVLCSRSFPKETHMPISKSRSQHSLSHTHARGPHSLRQSQARGPHSLTHSLTQSVSLSVSRSVCPCVCLSVCLPAGVEWRLSRVRQRVTVPNRSKRNARKTFERIMLTIETLIVVSCRFAEEPAGESIDRRPYQHFRSRVPRLPISGQHESRSIGI